MSESNTSLHLNEVAQRYFDHPTDSSLSDVILAAEGYVKYFRRLYGGSASYDDLYQAGMEGVLKALKEFDPDKGAQFSTFAGHKIMGEIRHWVRNVNTGLKLTSSTGM